MQGADNWILRAVATRHSPPPPVAVALLNNKKYDVKKIGVAAVKIPAEDIVKRKLSILDSFSSDSQPTGKQSHAAVS